MPVSWLSRNLPEPYEMVEVEVVVEEKAPVEGEEGEEEEEHHDEKKPAEKKTVMEKKVVPIGEKLFKGCVTKDLDYIFCDFEHHKIMKYSVLTGECSVLAGHGEKGHADGKGTAATFNHPTCLCAGKLADEYYIADSNNNCIRHLSADGTVTTIAGVVDNKGKGGYMGGAGKEAKFHSPNGIALGHDCLYVTDTANNMVRKVMLNENFDVSDVAGVIKGGEAGQITGAGIPAGSIKLNKPMGVAVMPANVGVSRKSGKAPKFLEGMSEIVLITDGFNGVRMITTPNADAVDSKGAPLASMIYNLASDPKGVAGFDNGVNDFDQSTAKFHEPCTLAIAKANACAGSEILVCDTENHCIRQLVLSVGEEKEDEKYAEKDENGQFPGPTQYPVATVSVFAGAFTDEVPAADGQLRKPPVGTAGSDEGYVTAPEKNKEGEEVNPVDGPAGECSFSKPTGITIDSHGEVYVSDENCRLRKIFKMPMTPDTNPKDKFAGLGPINLRIEPGADTQGCDLFYTTDEQDPLGDAGTPYTDGKIGFKWEQPGPVVFKCVATAKGFKNIHSAVKTSEILVMEKVSLPAFDAQLEAGKTISDNRLKSLKFTSPFSFGFQCTGAMYQQVTPEVVHEKEPEVEVEKVIPPPEAKDTLVICAKKDGGALVVSLGGKIQNDEEGVSTEHGETTFEVEDGKCIKIEYLPQGTVVVVSPPLKEDEEHYDFDSGLHIAFTSDMNEDCAKCAAVEFKESKLHEHLGEDAKEEELEFMEEVKLDVPAMPEPEPEKEPEPNPEDVFDEGLVRPGDDGKFWRNAPYTVESFEDGGEGGEIKKLSLHYTINGAKPTPNSPRFDPRNPIVLTEFGDCTIKAIAVRAGMKDSDVLTVTVAVQAGYDPINITHLGEIPVKVLGGSCVWKQEQASGDTVVARSGHSFDSVGRAAYLFGGVQDGPMNHLTKVALTNGECTDVEVKGPIPKPRWNHTGAVTKDKQDIIYFGGAYSDTVRFNDVWTYNVEDEAFTLKHDGVMAPTKFEMEHLVGGLADQQASDKGDRAAAVAKAQLDCDTKAPNDDASAEEIMAEWAREGYTLSKEGDLAGSIADKVWMRAQLVQLVTLSQDVGGGPNEQQDGNDAEGNPMAAADMDDDQLYKSLMMHDHCSDIAKDIAVGPGALDRAYSATFVPDTSTPEVTVQWVRSRICKIMSMTLDLASPDTVEELQNILEDDEDSPASEAIMNEIAIAGEHQPPSARCRHSVSMMGDKMFVYGGMGGVVYSRTFLNDFFLLDTAQYPLFGQDLVKSGVASHVLTVDEKDGSVLFGVRGLEVRYEVKWDGEPGKSGTPLSFDAIDEHIGGGGRVTLSDGSKFETMARPWRWTRVPYEGEEEDSMPRRSDHCTIVVGTRIFVYGGWNNTEQMSDIWVVETRDWLKKYDEMCLDSVQNLVVQCKAVKWEQYAQPLDGKRWNHTCCVVESIPTWKLFCFGGMSKGEDDQDIYLNDVQIYDFGLESWATVDVQGAVVPSPRADTKMAYSPDNQKFFIFGGWADEWNDQLFSLDCSAVIGPSYAVKEITPLVGPMTGGTFVKIIGLNFQKSDAVVVKFIAGKNMESATECKWLSDTELSCKTPDFEKFGAQEVVVRVSLQNAALSITFCKFTFFSNTKSMSTIAFGPGLLKKQTHGVPTQFCIQAKDVRGNNRWSGLDDFEIVLLDSSGKGDPHTDPPNQPFPVKLVEDFDDGTYRITYDQPPLPVSHHMEGDKDNRREVTVEADHLEMIVHVKFDGEDIRGSPYKVSFLKGGNPDNNIMTGPLATAYLTDQLAYLEGFVKGRLAGIRQTDFETTATLLDVKTNLDTIAEKRNETDLQFDVVRDTLSFLRVREGSERSKDESRVKKAGTGWNNAQSSSKKVTNDIGPYVATESNKTKEMLHHFEVKMVSAQAKSIDATFNKFDTEMPVPPQKDEANVSLDATLENWVELEKEYKNLEWLATSLEFPMLLQESQQKVERLKSDIDNMRECWVIDEDARAWYAQTKLIKWGDCVGETLEEESKSFQKRVRNLSKDIKGRVAFGITFDYIKDMVNAIPNLGLLKHPCLRPRHWLGVSKLLELHAPEGEPMPHLPVDEATGSLDNSTPLSFLLDFHLHKLVDQCAELNDQAIKEDKMEQMITKISSVWDGSKFKFEPHKKTDIQISCLNDEDGEVLEEHQMQIQNMTTSRYLATFEEPVMGWQKKLSMISEVMILFGDIVKQWAYFENLFIYSEEVKRELPEDSARFAEIDKDVKEIVGTFSKLGKPVDACNQDGLFPRLEAIAAGMALCEKSLNNYLDSKRKAFPRFYFVATADLLDILSNGNTPDKVMEHLSKMFQAVATLELEFGAAEDHAGRPFATGMEACVGKEYVEWSGGAFPSGVLLKDKVEQYMWYITDGMMSSLKNALIKAVDVYEATVNNLDPNSYSDKGELTAWRQFEDDTNKGRADWLQTPPSQVVLACLLQYWSGDTEIALDKMQGTRDPETNQFVIDPDKEALKMYNKLQYGTLRGLIELTLLDLKRNVRDKVMVMVTQDTHSRDVIRTLIDKGIDSKDDFNWMQQLKVRWDPYGGEDPNALSYGEEHASGLADYTEWLAEADNDKKMPEKGWKHSKVHPCDRVHQNRGRAYIAICDAQFDYGYEYLGNGARLVITPLTDRIYITATQGLALAMGCAPAGPAGTGKTESTKDLANALGKCCYVTNCSDQMDYRAMGDIFKGTASSGAWICYDEFNRLVPEVLSVCTVQYKSILDAIKEGRDTFTLGGDNCLLNNTCGAFITMNPGYLGRSELPEGLKALFRPITVVVPDLRMIMENFLMAEGFLTADILARKFFGLYSLCSSLLSKAMHYDWGLRAIKSVLRVAGGMKRASPELPEAAILMRALRDFNLPKIVADDLPVFHGLLGDLFPGLIVPRARNLTWEAVIESVLVDENLEPHDEHVLKIVSLEDLMGIRHCTFDMGPTAAAKSKTFKVLAMAKTKAAVTYPEYESDALGAGKVVWQDINPKSITSDEFYGFMIMATREWKDGIFSNTLRSFYKNPVKTPLWIILDGDLDANWIESMNSVMDDNKLLTLASNERIPVLPNMKLIFEIRDLIYATPATVSRAGILYTDTSSGWQWESHVKSWLHMLDKEDGYTDEVKKELDDLMKRYLAPALNACTIGGDGGIPAGGLKPVVPHADFNFVNNLTNLLECNCNEFNMNMTEDPLRLEQCFLFTIIWAFGSMYGEKDGVDYKKMYSEYWRNKMGDSNIAKMPAKGTVFDYLPDEREERTEKECWKEWKQLTQKIAYNSLSQNMTDVTVPTSETTAVTYIMDAMVDKRRPIMMVGSAGCGKTALVNGLLKNLPEEKMSTRLSFNYYTTSAQLQVMLEAPLEKKTGKIFGPPGKNRMIFFVDDLNMPMLDPYNTQKAIALLRQHFDYQHWYDMTKLALKDIINCQYISAMNPTAGSFIINPRLQRWYLTFSVGLPEESSLNTIYDTFLQGHFNSCKFNKKVQEVGKKMIESALSVQKQVISTFRKTAINFHYEFNVRHLTNVFSGLLMSRAEQFKEPEKFVRMWCHESERVYCDRLVNNTDIDKFKELLSNASKKIFPQYNMARFFLQHDPAALIFCHFASGDITDKCYDGVDNLDELTGTLEHALKEYNDANLSMDLVLFEDACKHICRITRIINNPSGHALLVGVGGSGKQSLSRLSAYICGYATYQIVISATYGINDLKNDLMAMFIKAGKKQEGTMFLFTDSQITNERFCIFLNDLLSSGDIPDLFVPDDVEDILNAVRPRVKEKGILDTRVNMWNEFIDSVKMYLHVVLCFAPSDDFRIRAQRFPALVTCTVIDWFQPWPAVALQSVAERFMGTVDLAELRADQKEALIAFMPLSFVNCQEAAVDYLRTERRFCYSTPKSFLEFILLYTKMLTQKRDALNAASHRLKNGIEKLQDTEYKVAGLQEDLNIKSVDVENKKTNAEAFAAVVSKEKAIVDKEASAANIEADKVKIISDEVGKVATDCEAELAKAGPAVEAAEAALATLNKKDLGETKALKSPPKGVDEVTAAVMCMIANTPGADVATNKAGKVVDRSWKATGKMIGNPATFMDLLLNFKDIVDAGDVPDINFVEVRPYLAKDFFNHASMFSKSQAAAGLCEWAINVVMFYDIVKEIRPKRANLAIANEKLGAANAKLAEVMGKVKVLQDKVDELQQQFDAANKDKNDAVEEQERCQMKLDLAQRLINALSSSKVLWNDTVGKLEAEMGVVVGDVLVGAAFLSYIGPFTRSYRTQLMDKTFMPYIIHAELPMTEGGDPRSLLCSEVQVAKWNTEGLPADAVSVQNGIITKQCVRWPLMIDPQLQGITWVKESEKNNGLKIDRLGKKTLLPTIKEALRNGWTVIIENMGERVDAVLSAVIGRQFVSRAGGRLCVPIGGEEIEYNPSFRLVMQTKLSNPHYPPEVQAEATLINFSITEDGLEDQLLAKTVALERPDLAEQKDALLAKQNADKIKLQTMEDNILDQLTNAEGDILENVPLVEDLENSKKTSEEIAISMEQAVATTESIMKASEEYRPVANRGSMLFFLMMELAKIHTLYMFSLDAFVSVFRRGINLCGEGGSIEDKNEFGRRIVKLIDSISITSFSFIRRGLLERHKLLVAVHLCFKILKQKFTLAGNNTATGGVNPVELNDFLIMPKTVEKPPHKEFVYINAMKTRDDVEENRWMSEAMWKKVSVLKDLKFPFGKLHDDLDKSNPDFKVTPGQAGPWEEWFDHESPETAPLPAPYDKPEKCPPFYKLLLLRAMRPDRMPPALTIFIAENIGVDYVEQSPFDMAQCYNESTSSTPFFFVLFPGVDPTVDVEALGAGVGGCTDSTGEILNYSTVNGKFNNISMGQGQEQYGLDMLTEAAQKGTWVFLQNVHLMQSWLKSLEGALEKLAEDPKTSPDFRCFISGEPPPTPQMRNVPEPILQASQKIANESPSSVKPNWNGALALFDQSHVDACLHQKEFAAMLMSLCFFHAIVGCRRGFGSLGWSRAYPFNKGDLTNCADLLLKYLNNSKTKTKTVKKTGEPDREVQIPQIPWEDLRYLFGEIMYGGHITDDWDRRTNSTYLLEFMKSPLVCHEPSQAEGPEVSPGMKLPNPRKMCFKVNENPERTDDPEYVQYQHWLEKEPVQENPRTFGMHPNAAIATNIGMGGMIFETIVDLTGGGGGGGGDSEGPSKDDIVGDKLEVLLADCPDSYEMGYVNAMIKEKLNGEKTPYTVVCLQEMERMNILLAIIRNSLVELKLGMAGALNMSDLMESLLGDLFVGRVNGNWAKFAYASKKPLASWFSDLRTRCMQLIIWADLEAKVMVLPLTLWLPGLFNPMSFLTAVMQTTARKNSWPLDQLALETHPQRTYINNAIKPIEVEEPPADGVYVHGLFMECARWDDHVNHVAESRLKDLYPPMPVVQVKAVDVDHKQTHNIYTCPMYVTSARGATFVTAATLKHDEPSPAPNAVHPNNKWIMAGVCILLTLDD